MKIPLPQSKHIIQENGQLQREVITFFKNGDFLWNTGENIQKKKEGLNQIVQGLRKMQLWIEREGNREKKEQLQIQYDCRKEDICKRLEIIEEYEKGEISNDSCENQQPKIKQGGQGKEGEKDQQNKFYDSLSKLIVKDRPNVKWTDIAGQEQGKQALKEAVILPLQFPHLFQGARIPWRGILLYGAPGTGKTYLAKACAAEIEGTFFSLTSTDLISQQEKESEELIKTLFTMARELKPSIIFIDEIDYLFEVQGEGRSDARKRVIVEFFKQMCGDGYDNKGVFVLGATNVPWKLDGTICKRFDKRIYITLPSIIDRINLIENTLKKTQNNLTKEQFEDLAVKTEGYSGQDIIVLIRDAVYEPIRKLHSATKFKQIKVNGQSKWTPVADNEEGIKKTLMELKETDIVISDVCYNDFLIALKKTKRSVTDDQVEQYEKWSKQYGQEI